MKVLTLAICAQYVTHKNTEWRKPDRKAENERLNRKERTANTNYFLEGNKAKRIGKGNAIWELRRFGVRVIQDQNGITTR